MYMKHGAFYLVRKRKWERLDSDYQGALLANARLVGGSGKSGMPKLEQQVVDSNPCTGIRRHTEKKCDRYITDAEFSAIYASSSDCMRCIFEMCYLTGQRISDVLAIRLADISATGIAFEPQKNGAKLIVGMSPDLEDLLARVKPLPRRVRGLTLLRQVRRQAGVLRDNEAGIQGGMREGKSPRSHHSRPSGQIANRHRQAGQRCPEAGWPHRRQDDATPSPPARN